MINTFKSMGQSVHSLGNKALAHPHWAGKTGFAVLTLILLAVCAVAMVVLPLMFLFVGMAKNLGEGNAANFKYYDAVAEDHADTVRDQERWAELMDD
jgi:hypothetical protein